MSHQLRHTHSLSESCSKLEEVKEEETQEDEVTSQTPPQRLKQKADSLIFPKKIPSAEDQEIIQERTSENKSKEASPKAEPLINTKHLRKDSGDLSPEVTTTQDFIAKINKIYSEKSRLNSVELSFIGLILVVINGLNFILNVGTHNEITSTLIGAKIRFTLTASFFLLGVHKFLSQKKIDKHFHTILVIFISFVTFLNNSLFIHFLFCYKTEELAQAPHSVLFERDLRILNTAVILIYYRFEVKKMLLYTNFLLVILFATFISVIYFKLGIWKNYEDYIVSYFYVGLALIFITISRWKNYFIKNERNLRREAIEIEAAKIKEELDSVKKKLESTFKTVSRPETASKADELLMKLKYLKFQALVNLKNKIISPNSGKRKHKRSSNLILSDNCGSLTPSRVTKTSTLGENQQTILLQKLEAYDMAQAGEKTKSDKKWTLTPEDVDEIMQGIISKPNMFWLPTIFSEPKETKFKMNKEAKDFLYSHFTEKPISKEASDIPSYTNLKLEFDLEYIDYNPLNKYLSNVCQNWNYDIFLLQNLTNGNVVIEFGYSIFKYFKIDKVFKISDKSIITKFFSNIQNMYRANPYHNAMHATDVCNSVGFFLVNGLTQIFNQLECSSLLVSALAHDLGHPGLNNAFLVATKSRYAIIYNDQSVLENFHTSSLFQILLNENADITKNLNEKEWRQFRKCCVQMILDTDLQKHFIIMNKFKSILALGEVDFKDESNRLLSLSTALKCADIGHGAKGLELHKKWSRRIIEEFFQQGDMEHRSGFPVSPLCDRTGNISKSQEGFLKCIVLPLFESFQEFMKKPEIKEACVDQIHKNLQYWDEQKKKEEVKLGFDLANFFDKVEKICPFLEETKEVYEDIKNTSNTVSDNLSAISV